jgi:polygalacturonase
MSATVSIEKVLARDTITSMQRCKNVVVRNLVVETIGFNNAKLESEQSHTEIAPPL